LIAGVPDGELKLIAVTCKTYKIPLKNVKIKHVLFYRVKHLAVLQTHLTDY